MLVVTCHEDMLVISGRGLGPRGTTYRGVVGFADQAVEGAGIDLQHGRGLGIQASLGRGDRRQSGCESSDNGRVMHGDSIPTGSVCNPRGARVTTQDTRNRATFN